MRLGQRMPLRIGGAALLLSVATILPLQVYLADPLERIRGSHRLLEPRLSAFEYTTFHVSRSGQTALDARAYEALADLQREVKRERSPENLHRLALAQLAIGKVASAHQLLVETVRLSPADAAILSDLAAAEMALGLIFDAAEHSAYALELDPQRQPAAFNWALALERASNRVAAIGAWKRYLELDASSGWAAEARLHLQSLLEPRPTWETDRNLLRVGADVRTIERLVRQYPQRARARTHNILLPEWIESGRADDLALIRAIASVRANAGDPFLHDVVENAAGNRAAVTAGFRAFAAARAAEMKSDTNEAGARYAEAADLLDRTGSPLAITAAIYAATDDFYGGRSDIALSRLDNVDRRLAALGSRYASMEAEALWARALVLSQLGEPHRCLQTYRRALEAAQRAGDVEPEASINALIAAQLGRIDDPVEADRFRVEALRRLDEINAHPNPRYNAFADAATSSLRTNRPRLALAFVDAEAEIARQQDEPMLMATSEAHRALALQELGRSADAVNRIGAAREQAMRIKTAELRDRTLAEIDFITGRIELEAHPDRAVIPLTAAIDVWERYGWRYLSATGRLARGEAMLATGNRLAAERDFRAGIADIEEQRRDLDEPELRMAYFERADRLFERLIELLLDDGKASEALSIVERKRSRLLLERIAATRTDPRIAKTLEGDEVAGAVRAGTAILEVALLDRGVELWLVREGRIIHARSSEPRAAIEAAVARHLAAIAAEDAAAVRREGRWLYDQLIAPVSHALTPDSDLVIVPDAVLQAFPFATLVLPNGEYFIERHTIASAPSASVFLRSPSDSTGDAMLAVAQPRPAGFDPLPSATAEAEAIARGHQRGRVFVGEELGPAEFLDMAGDVACVHFAGHATVDLDRPARSALLFEAPSDARAALTAETIGRSRLRSQPLVVLAACSTGTGKMRRNEGIDSLAAAFLQAGARGVVATLWDIDDASSANLFRAFHENLRGGARAADALRDAQRSLLGSNNPRDRSPAAWGSPVVIGSL